MKCRWIFCSSSSVKLMEEDDEGHCRKTWTCNLRKRSSSFLGHFGVCFGEKERSKRVYQVCLGRQGEVLEERLREKYLIWVLMA